MEVNRHGVLLYYYKGLIRSHFKVDFYAWNAAGYIEPKPVSERWTFKRARRGTILLDYDVNGDGHKDLVLAHREGVQAFHRLPEKIAAPPFDREKSQMLFPWREADKDDIEAELAMAAESNVSFSSNSVRRNRIDREGQLALIKNASGGGVTVWRYAIGHGGQLVVQRVR